MRKQHHNISEPKKMSGGGGEVGLLKVELKGLLGEHRSVDRAVEMELG